MSGCREGKGKYLYHYFPPQGFWTYEELYSLMPSGSVKGKADEFNKKIFDVLGQ